jgi:hypothetical protein
MFAYLNFRGWSMLLGAIAIAGLCAGGCAADNGSYYASSPTVAGYVAQVDRVEIEDDGLPGQAAPSLRIRQMPDDPAEPYSPNYGGANPASRRPMPPAASQQALASRPKLTDDLPPDFRRQLAEATAGSQ